MSFSARNAYYLRVSNYRVIPLFLYLDERHVDWMTDKVLQLVVGELQSKMRDLLSKARYEKKHKVFAERGEGYQYCYFLRTTTRTEVVLLKEKTHTLRAPTPEPSTSVETNTTPTKRKRSSRTRSRSISVANRDDSPPLVGMDDDGIEIKPEPSSPAPPSRSAEEDKEEDSEMNIKDMKPSVEVSYKGFGTSSLQLVLIIEPYPALDPKLHAPPSSRLSTRSASIPATYVRAKSKIWSGTRESTDLRARTSRSRSGTLDTGVDSEPRNRRSESSKVNAPNMRNASRSISTTPVPNSRRGGTSVTPSVRGSREEVTPSTPTPSGYEPRSRNDQTPLFIPYNSLPGDWDDEEDEEAHEAYTEALSRGRLRLPSVSRPSGTPAPGSNEDQEADEERSRSVTGRRYYVDDGDNMHDLPDGMMRIGERLVRSSEIEAGVNRVQGGWEERAEGEESAVMGREDPDE